MSILCQMIDTNQSPRNTNHFSLNAEVHVHMQRQLQHCLKVQYTNLRPTNELDPSKNANVQDTPCSQSTIMHVPEMHCARTAFARY